MGGTIARRMPDRVGNLPNRYVDEYTGEVDISRGWTNEFLSNATAQLANTPQRFPTIIAGSDSPIRADLDHASTHSGLRERCRVFYLTQAIRAASSLIGPSAVSTITVFTRASTLQYDT